MEPIIEGYLAPFKAQIAELQKQVRILSGQMKSESADLTLHEVAIKLNQSYTTVYRWVYGDKSRCKEPILKARRTGRTYRISTEELELFKTRHTF